MNKRFDYILPYDVLEEYYKYIMWYLSDNKSSILWLKVSIPFLLVCTIISFKLYNIYLLIIVAISSVIWFFYLSNIVYKRFINLKISKKTTQDSISKLTDKKHITSFEDNIIFDGKSYNYNSINNIIPLKNSLVIMLNETTILLPYSLFNNDAEVGELYKDILAKKVE